MIFRYASVVRLFCACTFVVSLCISSRVTCNAQTALRADTLTKIALKVHLSLGSTTLAAACKTLSAQTGLTIEPIAYLQERTLLLEIDGLSARATLDALAEANEWNWHETTPGHILISRVLPRYPQNLPQISKYVVAAIPKDIRDFIYLGKTPEELKRAVLPQDMARPADFPFQKPSLTPESADDGCKSKLMELTYRAAVKFAGLLEPKPKVGAFFAYKQMKPEAQKQLLIYMVFATLRDTSRSLLENEFSPYQLDMTKATMELGGNMLSIGQHTIEGKTDSYSSFGAQAPHLPEAPLKP